MSFGAKKLFVGKDTNFGQLLMDKERRESRIGGRSLIFPETLSAFRFLQPETSRDLRLGKISNKSSSSESKLLCKCKDVSVW